MNQIRNRQLNLLLAIPAVLGLCLLTAGPAAAQYATGFEAADVDGNYSLGVLTGQNGWYLPNTSSDNYVVDTNDGGLLGLPVNPQGGGQLIEAMALGNGNFPRAQQNVAFASGVYTLSYDFCLSYNRPGRSPKNNAASVSLQDSTSSNYFQTLQLWLKRPASDGSIIPKPSVTIGAFGANGGSIAFYRIVAPGAGIPEKIFDKIKPNNWYTHTVTWDFGSNTITATSITDLTGGGTPFVVDFTQLTPTLYLAGGANNTLGLPAPTAIRFFCGGGTGTTPGNIAAWDNVSVTAGAAPVAGQLIPATLVPVKNVKGETK